MRANLFRTDYSVPAARLPTTRMIDVIRLSVLYPSKISDLRRSSTRFDTFWSL